MLSMNVKHCLALLQKTAILAVSIGVSTATIRPVFAQSTPLQTSQLNPHPSIFNEPPYNRAFAPRSEMRPGNRPRQHRSKHGDRTRRSSVPRVRTRPDDPTNRSRPDDRDRLQPRDAAPQRPIDNLNPPGTPGSIPVPPPDQR